MNTLLQDLESLTVANRWHDGLVAKRLGERHIEFARTTPQIRPVAAADDAGR